MNTTSIERCLKTLLKGRGIPIYVKAADETNILSFDKFPFIVVQNTREKSHKGQHWTAWVIWNKMDGDFFDSFGASPEKYSHIVRPVKNILERNENAVQGSTSYVCGEHCIYWSYHRINGMSYKEIMSHYFKIPWYNDRIVTRFVNRIPNCHRHGLYNTCIRVQDCTCKLKALLEE